MLHKLSRKLLRSVLPALSLLLALLLLTAAGRCPGRRDAPAQLPPSAARLSAAVKTAGTDEPPAEEAEEGDAAEEATVEEKQPPEDALSAVDILSNTTVVAHGMGKIGGLNTPNCLEGFLAQYEAGVRVFEADLRLTRDCQVVLRHDWWPADWQENISWSRIPTRDQFVSTPICGQYTPLSFRDLLVLLEIFPDICIITDSKFTDSDVFTIQFDAMLADAKELGLTYLFDRIVVQIYNTNMLQALNNIYPFPHYIYTFYQDRFDGTAEAFQQRAAFCAQWGLDGVTLEQSLWKKEYAAIAQTYGIHVYVHTVNDRDTARRLLEEGVDGIYSDTLAPDELLAASPASPAAAV